jgi:hypothetical protein
MLKTAMAEAAPQFREEEFFEYHIYTLERPSTIKDNQTKQIRLLKAAAVPVKKELLFKGERHYFYAPYGEQDTNLKVGVFLEIENRKSSSLGMPSAQGDRPRLQARPRRQSAVRRRRRHRPHPKGRKTAGETGRCIRRGGKQKADRLEENCLR